MTIVTANTVQQLDKQMQEAGERLVVIMFTSPTCAACRNINPKISQLSTDFENKVVVIKVDVTESNDLAHRYHIHLLPTFMFMRYGKSVDKFSGSDATMLNNKIKSLLNK